MMLRNVLSGCRPGWALGREIGVAGRDDLEPLLGYDEPVLTTISYDHRAAVRELVAILDRRLCGGEVAKVEIPARVVGRSSLLLSDVPKVVPGRGRYRSPCQE